MEHCTDAALAVRTAEGDVEAFELVVRRHADRIHGMAVRMLGDWADAEDVVQDVFAIAWHRIHELNEPGAFRTWLFQIAHRQCLMTLRRRRTRRTEPVDNVPEHRVVVGAALLVTDPHRLTEATEGIVALREAVSELPKAQRDVWLLAELVGLSYTEIGNRLGVGEQAVRGRLSRARANLAMVLRHWR